MKKIKPINAVIAALVLLTIVSAAVHFATRTDVPEGMLRVEYSGTAVELSVDRLELEPVRGTLRSGKGEELTIDGQGLPLSQVLECAGAGNYSEVTVTANDEYSAVVTAEEVADPGRVYLLLEEDGSLRLVVFGDENRKRNVSDVRLVSVS